VAETRRSVARPLSPHLQVYRFTLLMATSILHRITGGALYLGMILLVWWLVALASGPRAYATFTSVAASPLGILVLVGLSFALMQHLMGGVRHLIWDTGASMDVASAKRLAAGGLLASAAATVALWATVGFVAYAGAGG